VFTFSSIYIWGVGLIFISSTLTPSPLTRSLTYSFSLDFLLSSLVHVYANPGQPPRGHHRSPLSFLPILFNLFSTFKKVRPLLLLSSQEQLLSQEKYVFFRYVYCLYLSKINIYFIHTKIP